MAERERKTIHLSTPHMSGVEKQLVLDAFTSNWLSTVGPHIDGFESEVAAMLGAGVSALAVSSGTAALHLILRHLGVSAGDRVAVSTLTFAASVWPILYERATPVFIDSETISGNLDPDLVDEYLAHAARVGQLPKALIAVHLYGQHADIDRIAALCANYGVDLVEDCAESLGATYRGRQTGTTADYSFLSFNGNKIITTTSGGMVISKHASGIAKMRKLANQSREPVLEYLHLEHGYNYRMSNLLAAVGRGQLRVLAERVAQRQAVFERYRTELGGVGALSFQQCAPWGTHTRWLTVAYLDPARSSLTVTRLVGALAEAGIESRPVWRPMHMQPMFGDAESVGGEVARRLYQTGICLPSSSSLEPEAQGRVIEALRDACR